MTRGMDAGEETHGSGEHAVHGVEGHAEEQDDGEQEEGAAAVLLQDEGAGGERKQERGDGDLVGGDASAGERVDDRAEEVLETGFEVVDGGH